MPAEGSESTALSIDFGTSNTVAVLRRADGRTQPLMFDRSPLLPSAVYSDPDGQLLVGRDAVDSARRDPGRYEPNPKRRVDDGEVRLGERAFNPVELVAAVLARVASEAGRTAGANPGEATLTCPASWGASRRLILTDAAARAGLPSPVLVDEPVAAAAYFAQVLGREVPIGSVVIVYDLGAGTFDASVVARTGSGFEVLAVDGRADLGGLDIDQAIVEHLGERHAEQDTKGWSRLIRPTTVEDRRYRRLFYDDVCAAKERLSRQTGADLVIPLLEIDASLTRMELERLIRPMLDQTVRVTQGVMRWSKIAEGRSAGVFLVGGSSRIPLVSCLLTEALGEPPVAIEQPELVVAEGGLLVGSARPTAARAWVTGSRLVPISPSVPATATPPQGTRPRQILIAGGPVPPPAPAPPAPAAAVPVAVAPTAPPAVPAPAVAPKPATDPIDGPTEPVDGAAPADGPTERMDSPTVPNHAGPAAPNQAGSAVPSQAGPRPPTAPSGPRPPAAPSGPRPPGARPVPTTRQPPRFTPAAVAVPRPEPPTPAMPNLAPSARQRRPGAPGPGRGKAGVPRPVTPRQVAAVQSASAIKRRSGAGRFWVILITILVVLTVPIISAYVAYKLSGGEPLFPITVDWHKLGLG
jgi:Hsp70 protein